MQSATRRGVRLFASDQSASSRPVGQPGHPIRRRGGERVSDGLSVFTRTTRGARGRLDGFGSCTRVMNADGGGLGTLFSGLAALRRDRGFRTATGARRPLAEDGPAFISLSSEACCEPSSPMATESSEATTDGSQPSSSNKLRGAGIARQQTSTSSTTSRVWWTWYGLECAPISVGRYTGGGKSSSAIFDPGIAANATSLPG